MFDARKFLESMLDEGQKLAKQGGRMAAGKLGVGQGEQSAAVKGAVGGAAAMAALGLLLGTKTGRGMLKLGTLAALGTVAYKAWQNHSSGARAEDAIAALPADRAQARATVLLQAMIMAARADGHVDDNERALIEERLATMGEGAQAFLTTELMRPIDPKFIASLADGPQAAREILAISLATCGGDDPAERAYLDDLAVALGISSAEVAEIAGALRA